MGLEIIRMGLECHAYFFLLFFKSYRKGFKVDKIGTNTLDKIFLDKIYSDHAIN